MIEKTINSTVEQTKKSHHSKPSTAAPSKLERVSRYDILRELGRGSCGVVYKAHDPFVQRDVAIKIASLSASGSSDMHQVQKDFFREVRAAGKLLHPNIVALYDAGIIKNVNYIVMEYINGKTLWEYTRDKTAKLSIKKIVEIIFKCAKALDYSHSQGVLHRDIKPGNIMLTEDLDVRIMDFSIAEITHNMSFKPDEIVGSPAYMSPEQIEKGELGAYSDLYSLGAVAFHLLAAEPPFSSDDVAQVFKAIKHSPPPRLDEVDSNISKSLADIVDKCLEKNPRQRYQSGNELALALTRVFDQLNETEQQVNRREQQNALRNLAFFSSFSDAEIDEILDASVIASYRDGDYIIREGDIETTFYILAKGDAVVQKGLSVIETLKTGDCFGEIGFLAQTKRTASVIAKGSAMVLKVKSSLMDTASTNCQLRYYKAFTETLIYRLSITSARLSARG